MKEDYKELIWELYAFGNKETYEYEYNCVTDYDRCTITDSNYITGKDLYDAYKKYLTWWDKEFSSRKPEFIKSDDKKMTAETFITTRSYKKSYIIQLPNPARDNYLFGGIGIKRLNKMLLLFKSVYDKDKLKDYYA